MTLTSRSRRGELPTYMGLVIALVTIVVTGAIAFYVLMEQTRTKGAEQACETDHVQWLEDACPVGTELVCRCKEVEP